MKFTPTFIPDLYILEPNVIKDNRGFFLESYNKKYFDTQNLEYNFIQDNHSKSSYGVLRGLHFQHSPFAQSKLVRVTKGKVLDVAVDLRIGSPTYLQHFSLEISDENHLQLLIPRGFAHGFVVLSHECEFLYKCDNFYDKPSDAGILYNDITLNIDWKIPFKDMILSEKDKNQPNLENAIFNFPFQQYTQTK